MSNSFYDLNIAFPGDEPDPAKLPLSVVESALAQLPEAMAAVATEVLIAKRSIADVAASHGLTDGDVVSLLQQAQLTIGMHLFQQHGGRH